MGFKNLTAAIRAPFAKRFGVPYTPVIDYAMSNGFEQVFASTADTEASVIPVYGVNTSNQVLIAGSVYEPVWKTVTFPLATSAQLTNQRFWIADQTYVIKSVDLIYATANGATMTAQIVKVGNGNTIASGVAVQTGSFNLNTTINTNQRAVLSSNPTYLQVNAGDTLAILFTGSLTSLAGLEVTLSLSPGNKNQQPTYRMNLNAGLVDTAFYVANRPMIVTGIQYIHSTAGTNGSAVNLQVTKDTSTDAPGAGTDLLTNNTNAGFNCKGTADTVQTGTLTGTAASLRLAPGDRLSVDFSGTLTSLAGVVVVVTLQPIQEMKEITLAVQANGAQVDQAFFTADRSYKILAIREVHSVLGTNGSAVNLQVTLDKAAEAPGAGVDLLTNNANAGFDLKGTINTVQNGTFVDQSLLYMLPGDRLSLDYAGVVTSVAGVVVTVLLEAA